MEMALAVTHEMVFLTQDLELEVILAYGFFDFHLKQIEGKMIFGWEYIGVI